MTTLKAWIVSLLPIFASLDKHMLWKYFSKSIIFLVILKKQYFQSIKTFDESRYPSLFINFNGKIFFYFNIFIRLTFALRWYFYRIKYVTSIPHNWGFFKQMDVECCLTFLKGSSEMFIFFSPLNIFLWFICIFFYFLILNFFHSLNQHFEFQYVAVFILSFWNKHNVQG